MKTTSLAIFGSKIRLTGCLFVALLALSTIQASAATGKELFMSALSPGYLNKGIIDCPTLVEAVTTATTAHKDAAPEIVAAALQKASPHDCECPKLLIAAAIHAVGNPKEVDKDLIPKIVAYAIRYARGAQGIGLSCDCAAGFVTAAIQALGDGLTDDLVASIVTAGTLASGPDCAKTIADAATDIAPLFSATIADAAARATDGTYKPDTSIVKFDSNGRVIPAPFTNPPSLSGTIAPGEVTPVN